MLVRRRNCWPSSSCTTLPVEADSQDRPQVREDSHGTVKEFGRGDIAQPKDREVKTSCQGDDDKPHNRWQASSAQSQPGAASAFAPAWSAVMRTSPFTFPEAVMEAIYQAEQLPGLIRSTDYILKAEIGISCVLILDIFKAANGRPMLVTQMWLVSSISVMLAVIFFMRRSPQVFGRYQIIINSALRIWLTLTYTQVRYTFPWLIWETKGASPGSTFFDRVFIRSFVAVIVVSGNIPLPLAPHLATHLIMVGFLGQWNGWYCGHILTLPEVATQLANLARNISPTFEYLTLLPLGLPGLGLKPFFGAPLVPLDIGANPAGPTLGVEAGYQDAIPCPQNLSLFQLWASVGGTLILLFFDWAARRRFLARALAAPGGFRQDPYKTVVCQLRVGGGRLIRLLVPLALGYSLFWALVLCRGLPVPFWVRQSLVDS